MVSLFEQRQVRDVEVVEREITGAAEEAVPDDLPDGLRQRDDGTARQAEGRPEPTPLSIARLRRHHL